MARGEGIPASHALDERSIGHWLGTQPREVATTLAARAALRALPLLVAEWERPGFEVLPFFRIAQATWAFLKTPNQSTSAATRAALQPISENSNAGSAVILAAAATLPRAHNNVSEFAARAINAAVRADSTIADDTLAEVMFIDGSGNYAARKKTAGALVSKKLWSVEITPKVADAWRLLMSRMLSAGDNWDVWVHWYEDHVVGRPSLGEAFDIAVATLPNELWQQGPKAVNAEIKRLIEEHTPPARIPSQGAGPNFALSPAHRIGLAAASDIDAAGNNLGRLRQQLPLVREAADDLAGRLNPNTFPELVRNLTAYRAAIEGEPETIAWGVVFGRGVRLDNAAAAARRQIEDRLEPPLEDAAREALESVLMLHGPMILATAEGRELMDDADRMLLTREEQAALRTDALAVAAALNDDKEIIEPSAAQIVMEAVETIGEGPHPERGSVIGGAAIRNVTIWAVGIGAIAAIAGVGFVQAGAAVIAIEGLKKSKRFSALTDALGARIDGVLRTGTAFQNFVIRNEQPLRQMASNSAGMRWMLPCIDDVVRRNASKPPLDQS